MLNLQFPANNFDLAFWPVCEWHLARNPQNVLSIFRQVYALRQLKVKSNIEESLLMC